MCIRDMRQKKKTERKKPTEKVIKQLYAKSGNQCAFPGCKEQLFNEKGDNISNICHIEAAEKGGQRFNENSTNKERASYENLILLCNKHHKITDDVETYTVEKLKEMKRKHEIAIAKKISEQNVLSKYPSVLNLVINSLGKHFINDPEPDEVWIAPSPEEKIKFNNIKEYQYIIESYRVYQGKLNKIYEEIEKQGSSKKDLVIKNIKKLYLKEKGKYGGSLDKIRANADRIIESIENQLWKLANEQIDEEVPREAIDMSISVILTDAFMRCDILERPI